ATTSGPNAVKVFANRTSTGIDQSVPLIFGPAFHVDTAGLSRTAIAVNQGTVNAGLIVLRPNLPGAFTIDSGSTVHVTGGVMIDSSDSCAAQNNGNPWLYTPDLYVVGGSCLTPDVLVPPGRLHTGVSAFTDPLPSLPAPPNGT